MGLFFNDYEKKRKLAIAKVEFPSHKRILQDSIKLIKSTKNIETLLKRHDIAQEEYSWIKDQMNAGVPIYFKSNGYFPDELKDYANTNIVRIAKNAYSQYRKRKTTLKTEKAKESLKNKYTDILDECKYKLIYANNRNECLLEINDLLRKL